MFGNPLFAQIIDSALAQSSFPAKPENLYQPIAYILSLAGKRIRPQLVLLGADLFGYKNIEAAVPAALAIEYFHNFSLIHDDIMDKAPIRRGKATVHQHWNDSVAILSGDALLVKAYEQLSNCPVNTIALLLKTFNRIALEVCEGQQLDMDFELEEQVTEAQYIEMIRLKTSVLLGGALALGAIIADADVEEREKINAFGVNLGIAFQLQDDILDAYGNPDTFGKQVGGDILVNKKTILHILLKRVLDAADRPKFDALLALKNEEGDRKVQGMKELYNAYAVRELAEALKEQYMAKAYQYLADVTVEEGRKTDLYQLADTLMHRAR